MSPFDLIVAAAIAVSALMGYQRGAVREVVGLVAFAVSTLAALALLPVTVGIAGKVFHPHILAVGVAVIAGFAVVYLGLKLVGHLLATSMHKQALLGGADRSLGLFIGAVRALVLVGLFTLVFDRATPEGLKPGWITGAFFYPLGQVSGRTIAAIAPMGMKVLASPRSLLNDRKAPNDGPAADASETPRLVPAPTARTASHTGGGYNRSSRETVDRLVERTR